VTPAAPMRFHAVLTRLGPLRFIALVALFCLSAAWLYGGLASSWTWHPPGYVNEAGAIIGRDFVAVWAASAEALAGRPAAPYNADLLRAAEQAAIGAPGGFIAWLYPPTFLLLMLPMALLPYPLALGIWLALPLIGFAWVMYRVAPHPLTPLAAVIFPGTAQCLISGQNGVFSALLLAGGLLGLERRPTVAGLCFAGLSYKPQMAAAAFAALLFGRHWRALGVALGASLALAAASLLVFGSETWLAFLQSLGDARALLEAGRVPWDRMATVFAAARLAGAGVGLSYGLQVAVALGALGVLAVLWGRRAPLALSGSALVASIPLTTPYAYDYDLVMLLLALIWLTREGLATGFRRGEGLLLAVAWASPVAGWLIAQRTGVQLTWAVLLMLLWAVLRRAGNLGSAEPKRA
jgi:alpha-1,2-mannosyltransferase